jgi:hypothetical protein
VATRSQGLLDDELSIESASVSSTGTGNGGHDILALSEVISDFLSAVTELIGFGGANGIGTVIFRRAFLTFAGGLDSALSGLGDNLDRWQERALTTLSKGRALEVVRDPAWCKAVEKACPVRMRKAILDRHQATSGIARSMLQYERINTIINTPEKHPLTSMHQLAVTVGQSVDQLLGGESIGRAPAKLSEIDLGCVDLIDLFRVGSKDQSLH